ncbi:iron complex transport system permease protein [Tamaricihabitans halophyticus]|uniref:Iron complex transport system permease protein n=1 Tax=Tamaricihabitans halophyticus TaxID=1262583 RepID=A0A4R2R2H3_9PSEU|nr:iron chelate uptake ABC transporter family permease subunit [Tamaricihabitans halophyticus]TCP53635.1 iron complex transport system permease protein [Tamaricihabitans halophyticus]
MPVVEVRRVAGRTAFRLGRHSVSGQLHPRTWLVCLVLAVASFLVFSAGIAIGDYPLGFVDVVRALAGGGDSYALFVVQELRVPRSVVALLVGVALGMSGAILQTITRNPLASPDMIGITHGAGFAVVSGIVLGFGSGLGTQVLGLAGGFAAALLVYLLAWRRGTTGYRIVLIGIGVSWTCIAAIDYLMTRAYEYEAQQAMGWLVGNLNGRDYDQALPLLIALLVLVPATLLLTRWMRVLQLGDETASGLGTPVQLTRFALLLTAVGLAAFATAAAGPVLFVALAAPQIARLLCRTSAPPPVAAALTGALLVLASDLVARQLLADAELPVGIVTGAFGAAFLMWLLARINRQRFG